MTISVSVDLAHRYRDPACCRHRGPRYRTDVAEQQTRLERGHFYVATTTCPVVSICYVKSFGLLSNKVSTMELEPRSILAPGTGLLEILGYGITWIAVVAALIYLFGRVNKTAGIVGMVAGCAILIQHFIQ
ncbi:hypothetical protein NP88_7355 [Burkholderia cepacia]|nr:hypothetical protein NP88_7355 [Burkholderia cepacia]